MSTDILFDDQKITVKGDLVIRNDKGNDGDLFVEDKNHKRSIHLGGNDARVELGEKGGNDGDIFINDKDGKRSIHLGGNDARLELGHNGKDDGDIFINNKEGKRTIHLGGNDARLELGGGGSSGGDGDLMLRDQEGKLRVQIGTGEGKDSSHLTTYIDGHAGSFFLGGDTVSGNWPIALRTDMQDDIVNLPAAINDAIQPPEESDVGLRIGMDEQDGLLALTSGGSPTTMIKHGNCVLGDSDTPGKVLIWGSEGDGTITLNGEHGEITAKKIKENSDVRQKDNITSFDGAAAAVQNLRGVRFNWQDESKGEKELGLIAQETEDVVPEAVSEDKNGNYCISYSSLVPVLVEANKEQQEIIDEQRKKIGRLQQMLEDLENRIEQLERQQ